MEVIFLPHGQDPDSKDKALIVVTWTLALLIYSLISFLLSGILLNDVKLSNMHDLKVLLKLAPVSDKMKFFAS